MKVFLSVLALVVAVHAQWTRMNVPATAGLRGLSVVNAKVVWASGTGGTVLRSVDGGNHWSVMAVSGAEKLDLRGIHAFDQNDAVVISSGPAEQGQVWIYRTSDGGQHWSQVYQQRTPRMFFDAIAFWDHNHGIVLSDPVAGHFALFMTDDGGSTWHQLSSAASPAALPGEGAFAASNSCLVIQGKSSAWFATGGAAVARVFHSADRGKTWKVSATPMHPANAASGIFSLAFTDARDGAAAGGDYQHPGSSDLPNLMLTHDGGRSWEPAPRTDPAGIYFSSVVFDRGRIIAAGIRGMFTLAIGPHSDWQQESSENLNTIAGRDGVLWAVGAKGAVLKRGEQAHRKGRVHSSAE
jgi:photosystem II stability/assembly factor-like uncharacterized protein